MDSFPRRPENHHPRGRAVAAAPPKFQPKAQSPEPKAFACRVMETVRDRVGKGAFDNRFVRLCVAPRFRSVRKKICHYH